MDIQTWIGCRKSCREKNPKNDNNNEFENQDRGILPRRSSSSRGDGRHEKGERRRPTWLPVDETVIDEMKRKGLTSRRGHQQHQHMENTAMQPGTAGARELVIDRNQTAGSAAQNVEQWQSRSPGAWLTGRRKVQGEDAGAVGGGAAGTIPGQGAGPEGSSGGGAAVTPAQARGWVFARPGVRMATVRA